MSHHCQGWPDWTQVVRSNFLEAPPARCLEGAVCPPSDKEGDCAVKAQLRPGSMAVLP